MHSDKLLKFCAGLSYGGIDIQTMMILLMWGYYRVTRSGA